MIYFFIKLIVMSVKKLLIDIFVPIADAFKYYVLNH